MEIVRGAGSVRVGPTLGSRQCQGLKVEPDHTNVGFRFFKCPAAGVGGGVGAGVAGVGDVAVVVADGAPTPRVGHHTTCSEALGTAPWQMSSEATLLQPRQHYPV